MSSPTYKSGMLAQICRFYGVLSLIGGLAMAVQTSGMASGGSARMDTFLFVASWGIASLLVFCGIAEVLDYLGRSAHNSDRLVEWLPKLSAQLTEMEHRMSGSKPLRVSALVENFPKPPRKEATPAAKSPGNKTPRFYYSLDGRQSGPLSASQIRQLIASRVLDDLTPICREGDDEWGSLQDFPELS